MLNLMYKKIIAILQIKFCLSGQTCPNPEGGSRPPPMKNHKNIGFLSNTGADPLKIIKLPSLSIQSWIIISMPAKGHLMVFPWRADDGPLIVVPYLNPPSPHKLK